MNKENLSNSTPLTANFGNTVLGEVLNAYGFEPYLSKGNKFVKKIAKSLDYDFMVFVKILNDESIRVSIGDEDTMYFGSIDIMKTKDYKKLAIFLDALG